MPRGKFVNHKGRNRHFTNPEELEEQRRQEEEKKKWRKNRNLPSSEDEEEEDEKAAGGKKGSDDSSEDSDSESESETEDGKKKGVENLIQIENPNRVQKKAKKLSQLNEDLANSSSKPVELSRREREQIEKQKAAANYQRLHAAGKTDQARNDLARLAIIRQQRDEAAKKREEEKKAKELATQKQKEMTQKALGKRS